MCEVCNKKKCCCEKRVSIVGKKADQGIPGTSDHLYIAYASNVVAGSPDVVTGFSLTTPDCWMAVKNSVIPLPPVQANFQGLWKKICGPAGPTGLPSTQYASSVVDFNIPGTGVVLMTGIQLTAPVTGIYVIIFEGDYYGTGQNGASIYQFKKNGSINLPSGIRRAFPYASQIVNLRVKIGVNDRVALNAGDTIDVGVSSGGGGATDKIEGRSLLMLQVG